MEVLIVCSIGIDPTNLVSFGEIHLPFLGPTYMPRRGVCLSITPVVLESECMVEVSLYPMTLGKEILVKTVMTVIAWKRILQA